jgi:hypothetical protein
VGFYLSGHPLDDYPAGAEAQGRADPDRDHPRAAGGAFVGRIAGAVANRQERKSARGNRFAFVQLSDPTGLYEVTVFSDVLEARIARIWSRARANVVCSPDGRGATPGENETLKLLARAGAAGRSAGASPTWPGRATCCSDRPARALCCGPAGSPRPTSPCHRPACAPTRCRHRPDSR